LNSEDSLWTRFALLIERHFSGFLFCCPRNTFPYPTICHKSPIKLCASVNDSPWVSDLSLPLVLFPFFSPFPFCSLEFRAIDPIHRRTVFLCPIPSPITMVRRTPLHQHPISVAGFLKASHPPRPPFPFCSLPLTEYASLASTHFFFRAPSFNYVRPIARPVLSDNRGISFEPFGLLEYYFRSHPSTLPRTPMPLFKRSPLRSLACLAPPAAIHPAFQEGGPLFA